MRDVVEDQQARPRYAGHVELLAGGRGGDVGRTLPLADAVGSPIEHGYAGSIGCEYVPGGPTADTLGWVD